MSRADRLHLQVARWDLEVASVHQRRATLDVTQPEGVAKLVGDGDRAGGGLRQAPVHEDIALLGPVQPEERWGRRPEPDRQALGLPAGGHGGCWPTDLAPQSDGGGDARPLLGGRIAGGHQQRGPASIEERRDAIVDDVDAAEGNSARRDAREDDCRWGRQGIADVSR